MRAHGAKQGRRGPGALVAIAALLGCAWLAHGPAAAQTGSGAAPATPAEPQAESEPQAASEEAPGEPTSSGSAAPAAAAEDASPEDSLTAREIYTRVLDNRFGASVQELALASGDRVGREQRSRVQMLWKRYEEKTEEREGGILSRTLVRYLEPNDIRGTSYLVINKQDAPSDQFVYLPSMRRVRRMSLRSESIAGTDLNVEDIVPRELDDAEYARVPDELVEETPCYVVQATPTAEADSDYSRFWLYVEKEHYVPLRIRYWDSGGVEIKEMRSPIESIREFEGIWLPVESTMRQLLDDTYTTIKVDLLVPDPEIPKKYFTQRQLESTKLRLPTSLLKGARKP